MVFIRFIQFAVIHPWVAAINAQATFYATQPIDNINKEIVQPLINIIIANAIAINFNPYNQVEKDREATPRYYPVSLVIMISVNILMFL